MEKIFTKTEVVTIQELKKINTLLAASACKYFFTSQVFNLCVICGSEQVLRDEGLEKLTHMLVKEKRWVELE